MEGPNSESKITKKIRYFTRFPKINEITNLEKIRYLSQNFPIISRQNLKIRRLVRKIGRNSTEYFQRLLKLSRLRLIWPSSCNKRHFWSDFLRK